jgi:Concanavalin A-like lectin/glucanases superfamily
LYVDGVQRIAATDSSLTGAGRGGVRLGQGSSTAQVTNTAGLHLDNFRITSLTTTTTSSMGTNHGTYVNGLQLNQPGALVGATNRSTVFDGVDDHVSAAPQIAGNFSIEGWFKSTQGIGTGTQWWNGAGLVDAETSGNFYDFGVSLRSDGRVVGGVGHTPDVSIVSTLGGFNNGAWHHFVFTRTQSSGALNLYVDGQPRGSATGSTAPLTATPNINFGRIQPGANYYAGSLDDVSVYTSVLTPAQVLDHYRAGTGTG